MSDVPQDDVMYNVVIGENVTGGGDDLDHYHVLQYNFKPASIDGSQEGLLRKTENGGVDVEFANPGKTPENKVYFKGQYTPCKEYECILIFDSTSSTFRLERLMGLGKSLKVVRKDQTKPATRLEIPEQDTAFETTTTVPSTRPRGIKPKFAEHPITGNAPGSSPEDGSLSEGAVPGKRRGTRNTVSVPKRARKATTQTTKDTKPPEAATENAETDDLLALVDQIESSVPSEKSASQDEDQEEEEEDFLAAAFESENTYQSEPPIPTPLPSSTSLPPSSHARQPFVPSHKPPTTTIPPHPTHKHSHPPPTAGFPATNQTHVQNSNFPAGNGALLANGASSVGAKEESDSGSDSESASESESASDSASDSSSAESESENE